VIRMSISKDATIHPSAIIGEGAVIEEGVVIGQNCRLGHHVIVHRGTRIGDNVIISDQTVLGKSPFKAVLSAITADKTFDPLQIKEGCVIGALCIIYLGATLAEQVFVGDLASIREEVSIGRRTIIGKGVTVENRTRVGARCKIETNAYITALSRIEDDCFIAPEVTFTNDNYLGRTEERKKHFKGVTLLRGARVGANATVLPGLTIGEDGLLAAGSVLTKDLPAGKVFLGVPARYFGDVPEEQLLKNQTFYIAETQKGDEGC